ncbi:MAG: CYTH domain-containing protein [Eubacteriales bacterium]
MEIERKFLVTDFPFNLVNLPYDNIEQGYISTDPVIRIRKKSNSYFLTVKSEGLLSREEINIPINKNKYALLSKKLDYNLIIKKRYYYTLDNKLTAEIDVFDGNLKGLTVLEVEFKSEKEAYEFNPPNWFGEEVTFNKKYQNSNLVKFNILDCTNFKNH